MQTVIRTYETPARYYHYPDSYTRLNKMLSTFLAGH